MHDLSGRMCGGPCEETGVVCHHTGQFCVRKNAWQACGKPMPSSGKQVGFSGKLHFGSMQNSVFFYIGGALGPRPSTPLYNIN